MFYKIVNLLWTSLQNEGESSQPSEAKNTAYMLSKIFYLTLYSLPEQIKIK